jgi:hypothetical protein
MTGIRVSVALEFQPEGAKAKAQPSIADKTPLVGSLDHFVFFCRRQDKFKNFLMMTVLHCSRDADELRNGLSTNPFRQDARSAQEAQLQDHSSVHSHSQNLGFQ